MKARLAMIGLMFLLGVLALNGCAPATADEPALPTPVPTAVPTTSSPTEVPTDVASPDPAGESEEEGIREAEITSLDGTWNQYTNYRLGFTIRFPKEMATFRGSCYWNEEEGSYRPQPAPVPVTIFEDTDAVYIAAETYFELAGERVEENRATYDECNQVTNTLALLQDPERFQEPFWKLVVQEVSDEGELDAFIKARYGSGCSLGEQEPTGQEGVTRVRIQGDGKPMEETQCLLNYGTVVMYYPAGNKVIAWDTGQAATFPADVNYAVVRDMEMIESFQFLKVESASAETSSEVPAPAPVEEEEVTRAAEIVSLDETWNQYTNYRLSFTIRFPKEMAAMLGSCYWNEEQESYRPEMAFVPVQVFEDADAVYIAPEHYFELAGERVDGGTHYYDECNQITNSLELLRDHDIPMLQFWKLVVQEVRDEGELEDFVKARYGSGCSLGEQVASAQAGVFDVSILGDGKDLAESQCPMNYGYRVKYFPSGGRVIAWNIGQAWTFLSAVDWSAGYDFEMIESFRFLAAAAAPAAGTPVAPGGPLTSYIDDDLCFVFQYPADWALEVIPRRPLEGAGQGDPQWLASAIKLGKGKTAISIQYMHTVEESPVAWDGRFSGGGLAQEASKETVDLMGQEASKRAWTDEDGIKGIMVQTVREDADLVLQIELYDGSANGIYDPAAETLPEAAISVLDGILSSLTLTQ